ncbi:LysR family transcriptional regulator [Streptomyces sp. DSM 44915]|uniref:LysR family transcriptional regulator n=1 Tax=Streptomyces chisholmiae TaxID=3075540 RepID=A0ABU2JP44_9ACTN|nr:LysR family transcriptional regulator [Streptomyces sp. DSM 44915]MDT0266760.1 LysR family transcriptional regulator [Streptomyces sp. DSM 44915]
MDITALRSFREVHRTGSLTAAARALGYTQSALSRQIAALEAELGTPLLRRHARGVRPTPAGDVLLEHAAAILQRVDHAERDVRASRDRPVTNLRVGSVPSAAAALLPPALGAFRAAEPQVRVTFAEDVTPRLLPRLLDGELDLAVITSYPPGLPAQTDLTLTHLLDDVLVCVLPREHPAAALPVLPLAELADETWVEDYAGAASALATACARAGFTPRIDIECGSWLGKQAFVAAGHGVALAPRLLVPALRQDLAIRELADPPRRGVYAATRRRPGVAAEAAAAFRRALTETVGATTS